MGLDPRFILMSDLESLFRDKDTGLPLTNGVIYFWEDNNRTNPKPVYMISGTPPNYIYTALPNPLTLTSIGTFSDGSNTDTVPYWFPYDGDQNTSQGIVDLYFVEVYSQGGKVSGTLQFTREGWPNLASGNIASDESILNYIANGQFKLHSTIISPTNTDTTQVTQPDTIVAPGAWHYVRDNAGSSGDTITYDLINQYITNPTASPRYKIRVKAAPDGATFKYLWYVFPDVNKFASDTQHYTFSFTAKANNGIPISVEPVIFKNFGTGGSPSGSVATGLGPVTVGTSDQIFNTPFVFGNNTGKVLGTNQDDYVAIGIFFTPTSNYDISFTDFVLTPGSVDITDFPQQPDQDMIVRSNAIIPIGYNDEYIGLPIIQKQGGFVYDTSVVGKVFYTINSTPGFGELLTDGARYPTAGYSSDGIPYSRLQKILYDSVNNYPTTGTGYDFVSTYLMNVSTANLLRISSNSGGASIHIAEDGGIPTTFTFDQVCASHSVFVTGYKNGSTSLLGVSNTTGPSALALGAHDVSSGFSVVQLTGYGSTPAPNSGFIGYNTFSVDVGGLPSASTYFVYASGSVTYYMWFKIDGSGTDPAPGPTVGIEVDLGVPTHLAATWTNTDISNIVRCAMSGQVVTTVLTKAASSITDGSYFYVYGTGGKWYVWYDKSGSATDPMPAGTVAGIKVSIGSSDTDVQVASKTKIAMNSFYYQVPDYRGKFLRVSGIGPQAWDIDISSRFSTNDFLTGNNIGTQEIDIYESHAHFPYPQVGNGFVTSVSGHVSGSGLGLSGSGFADITTGYAGGSETRPINQFINAVIKY